MPVEATWDNEAHTVIREVFSGLIDLPAITGLLETVNAMMGTVQHTVDILALIGTVELDSRIIRQLPRVAQSDFWNRPNLGALVLVGVNPIISTAISLYKAMYPVHGRRLIIAPGLDDAYRLLDEHNRLSIA